MSNTTSQVSEKRLEVLSELKSWDGEIVQVTKLADLLDRGKKATRRLVKRMDEDGLVNYESSYSGSKVSLTSSGLKEIENNPYPRGNVPADVRAEGLKRLHGFVVTARIMSETPSEWAGTLQEHEEITVLDDKENDTIVARDKWVIRFHKEKITFQLREGCSISGNESSQIIQKAYEQVRSASEYAEFVADISIQLKQFRITRAELGFEGHPLSELAGDLPGVPLDRFQVIDEDLQKQVLTIDGSPEYTEELEAQSERTESIAQTIEDEMEQYARRPEAVEKRHELENEMMVQSVSGQELVHGMRQASSVSGQVEKTITEVNEVREEVSEMKQVLKDNKETREALHEQVRALNNLAQRNQELIEQEAVQEQENDRPDDLLEETVENVLDEDRFSAPGLQYGHLMVFDTMESECRKILDKSVVSKSDSRYKDLLNVWKGERP